MSVVICSDFRVKCLGDQKNRAITMFIRAFGELEVEQDGQIVPLPSSKKTRALLAYLAVTSRPHRRERLCELLWELPDDPRAALRWSLSKIRGVLNAEDQDRVIADRERVQLELSGADVDFVRIRQRLFDDPPVIPLPELRDMAAALEQTLLDGLEFPNQPLFDGWLVAEREDAHLLRLNVLRRLALHPDIDDEEASVWARRWRDADPLNPKAAQAQVAILRRLGRIDEAAAAVEAYRAEAEEAGLAIAADFDAPAQGSGEEEEVRDSGTRKLLRTQSIGFCRTPDGVRLAYATVGDGPPIVKAANWLNHLELDWNSPIWGRTFQAAAQGRTFIRYDERGNGLSDWDVDEISFESFVNDLETVVDALGLDRFPLLGISQGCAVGIEYAVRHPERVSALILVSGYATGWRIGASADEQERRKAVMTLTKLGWGTNNPAYRHIFSQTFMPDAKPEELEWFDDFQRHTTSAENAVRFQEAFGDIDVRESLGKVAVPTIVFHARDDQRIMLEQGRELAMGIPGARFVPLESRNHILLGHEPAWMDCVTEISRFIQEHRV